MRNRTKRQTDQRSLFQPLNPAISWYSLPSEIQQQSLRLLVHSCFHWSPLPWTTRLAKVNSHPGIVL
jgi:hypothetical protein